jgi:hypothetical protein
MKSILYVGATLMIGASIYGFVDYKKTSQQKEFSSMYDEEKKAPPVVEEEILTEPVNKDLADKKQAVSKEDVSLTKETKLATTEVKKSKPVVKKKKKKKLDHRIFSRAPLRDEELILPEPVKPAEEKKIVQKDSFGEKKEQ